MLCSFPFLLSNDEKKTGRENGEDEDNSVDNDNDEEEEEGKLRESFLFQRFMREFQKPCDALPQLFSLIFLFTFLFLSYYLLLRLRLLALLFLVLVFETLLRFPFDSLLSLFRSLDTASPTNTFPVCWALVMHSHIAWNGWLLGCSFCLRCWLLGFVLFFITFLLQFYLEKKLFTLQPTPVAIVHFLVDDFN